MSKKNKKQGTPVEAYDPFADVLGDVSTDEVAATVGAEGATAVDTSATAGYAAPAYEAPASVDVTPAAAPADSGVPEDIAESYKPATPKFAGATFKKLQPNGPIPVIAPINPVQLTPIVVPVAIVPYATQNQPMLQYASDGNAYFTGDGSSAGGAYADGSMGGGAGVGTAGAPGEYASDGTAAAYAADAEVAENGKSNKFFAFLSLLFGILTILPAVFAYVGLKLGSLDFSKSNFIGAAITSFSDGTILANIGNLLFVVGIVVAVVFAIVALVSLFAKKAPKLFIAGLVLIVLTVAGFLYNMIKVPGFSEELTADNLGYLLTVVFAVVAGICSAVVQVFATKKD